MKKGNQIKKQRIRSRYNNFRKIICILPEVGLTEQKHVTTKSTSHNKGHYIKSFAQTVFIATSNIFVTIQMMAVGTIKSY
jgi:hypothetical protein